MTNTDFHSDSLLRSIVLIDNNNLIKTSIRFIK